MAKIANVALTNTFNTWRVNSNIGFDRLSQFAVNNSSLYANTITANISFTSTGLATLSGRATVGTNLTVSGNTTLGAAGKTITSTGAAAHTGTKTISTNLTVSGNTTLGAAGKTITTTGAAAHTGTQSISTNLTVSGNTTLGAAGKTITSTGAAAHTGRATISTNLTVSGNTALAALSATSGTFSTTLGVTGVATFTAQPIASSLTASKPVFTDASKGLVSTGTLAYDQGGTGQTSYATGDIVYASGVNTLAKLAIGSSGQRLVVAAGIPSWATDATTGTVTSVAAITLGTTGTDLSSTVANGTTTPVITLQVPTASASNRGALSAADWTTFNNKQASGSYVTVGGALGTPSSGTLTNCTFPTLNQNTSGTAGGLSGSPNITVGTITSGAVAVTGAITATGDITAFFSDRRLKTNVVTIPNALTKVMSLNGVLYTPNELAESFGFKSGENIVGLFADELEAILPEAVKPAPFDTDENGNSKSGENYKTIQYEKLVPLLIEAIKDLNRKIDQLQDRQHS